jgi:hypothetical protein
MSGNSSPGFSPKAQMRAARAELRRKLRLDIHALEGQLAAKKEELIAAELERNGQAILRRQKQLLPGGVPPK